MGRGLELILRGLQINGSWSRSKPLAYRSMGRGLELRLCGPQITGSWSRANIMWTTDHWVVE